MVYVDFFVLYFGEKFMKIRTKIPKLQMHENLHINVNENVLSFTFYAFFMSFYGGQLKQQICYSLTLLILYLVFNLFVLVVQLGRVAQSVTCLALDASLTADPGREFDPHPVPYFRGDFYSHSLPFR